MRGGVGVQKIGRRWFTLPCVCVFFFNELDYPFYFFFKDFFLMWTILKVCIEFVTVSLLFYVLVFWHAGS